LKYRNITGTAGAAKRRSVVNVFGIVHFISSS